MLRQEEVYVGCGMGFRPVGSECAELLWKVGVKVGMGWGFRVGCQRRRCWVGRIFYERREVW